MSFASVRKEFEACIISCVVYRKEAGPAGRHRNIQAFRFKVRGSGTKMTLLSVMYCWMNGEYLWLGDIRRSTVSFSRCIAVFSRLMANHQRDILFVTGY